MVAGVRHLTEYLSQAGKIVYQADTLPELGPILTSVSADFDVVIAFSAGRVDRELRLIVNAD